MRGSPMTQKMTVKGDERVLWDSARHYVVSRDGMNEMNTEMNMSAAGMTMLMKVSGRSLMTAQ